MSEKQPHVDSGSAPQIMSTPPTPTGKASRRDHDTGFPEPFGDEYNTTLPHPDADISPNAVISSDSLSAEHFMKRRRRSMLSKHRRTVSQHSTTSQQIHGILPLVAGMIPGSGDLLASPTVSSAREEGESVDLPREEEETPPTSPDVPEPQQQKRKSFIGKLRHRSRS